MVTETVVQQRTRLEHFNAAPGGQIWRNNSGAGRIIGDDGVERMIRWGLANESAQQNATIKSSDLIGITPTLIQPHMVGYWLGVFTAYEVKPSDWRMPVPIAGREFRDQPDVTKRALAQAKFHGIVRDACGYAGFVTDPADIYGIIGRG